MKTLFFNINLFFFLYHIKMETSFIHNKMGDDYLINIHFKDVDQPC